MHLVDWMVKNKIPLARNTDAKRERVPGKRLDVPKDGPLEEIEGQEEGQEEDDVRS